LSDETAVGWAGVLLETGPSRPSCMEVTPQKSGG
jgi:hypothetical protein